MRLPGFSSKSEIYVWRNRSVRVYLEPRRFGLICRRGREGFTLVELIVVVIIMGVLASIGVPAFQRSTIKARQAEAALLVNSYIKGVQAYFAEHGVQPFTAKELSEFVSVNACRYPNPDQCERSSPYTPTNTRKWISSNGYYDIALGSWGQTNRAYVTALPAGKFSSTGMPVTGCFNYATGHSDVKLHNSAGRHIPNVSC